MSPWLMTMVSGVSLLMTSSIVIAKDKADSNGESETKSAFPSLDILPEGSILKRVRLPRYDKDFKPSSMLKADQLTVVNNHQIDGKNVTIELYEKNGKVQARAEMRHAIYDQKDSTLHANESITVRGESFSAKGKGLIFHWNNKRGFLVGPATTEFLLNPPETTSTMQLKTNHPSATKALAGVLITSLATTLTTSVMAEPPERLTEAQLVELDGLVKPSSEIIKAKQNETAKILANEQQLVSTADATMKPFLKGIGQDALLVQNTATPQTGATVPKNPVAQKTTPSKVETGSKAAITPEPPQLLKIECDGGLYFDTDTGVLAYLKNVRLTEPRFKLNCTKELKVFLTQKEVEPKKGAKPEKENAVVESESKVVTKNSGAKKEGGESLSKSFGDLKRIVAIGEVRVVSKDENGKTFIATAETASYDAKTGEMILRGGLPRIQYGPNQYLASQAPGQYIRMLKNGKLVTTGKWAMQIDTSQTKKKSKP